MSFPLAAALLLAEQGLGHSGFSSWGSWALESTGSVLVAHRLSCSAAYGLPGPGIKSVSPAVTGGSFTTEGPAKSPASVFSIEIGLPPLYIPLPPFGGWETGTCPS